MFVASMSDTNTPVAPWLQISSHLREQSHAELQVPQEPIPQESQQEPEPMAKKKPIELRCLDASDSAAASINYFDLDPEKPVPLSFQDELVAGKIYRAIDYDEEFVMLEGMTDRYWARARFEDVVEEMIDLPVEDISFVFRAGPNEVSVVPANEQAIEEIPDIAAAAV